MRRTLSSVLVGSVTLALLAGSAVAGEVTVDTSAIIALEGKVEAFARSLPPGQRAVWNQLLERAAGAPSDNPADVRVKRVVSAPGGKGGDDPVEEAVLKGTGGTKAIGPEQDDPGAPSPGGTKAIGPKQDDPGAPSPGGAKAIGPKQDDPGAPSPGGAKAIGPKQDDPGAPPSAGLARRLREFSGGLDEPERLVLDWTLQRAGAGRPGTPGGLPPGRAVGLRNALGITPLAIGPKQDDPGSPPPARWTLRF